MEYKARREVVLPTGELAFETETVYYGGSETQVYYEYEVTSGRKVDKSQFKTNYDGRIQNLKFL